MRVREERTWPLFIGGFLGPFGGSLVTTMLPELASEFEVSVEVASTTLTAYLVPFAATMLVSGTLAERIGRRRTVRAAYLVYALASLAAVFAPSFEIFFLARILQGASNAFTTPVLVGAITDAVPAHRLNRSLGVFGSLQALGMAASPLAGGLAAAVDWRWAFVVCAVVAGVLFFLPPPDSSRAAQTDSRSRWRALANRKLALAGFVAGFAYLTTSGILVLTALYARAQFGLTPGLAGVLVAVFGVAGLLTGRRTGGWMDRFGVLPVGLVVHVVMGLACAAIALTAGLPRTIGVGAVVVLVGLGGVAGTACRSTTQNLAVTSAPTNRAGASSVMLACQFGGSALAPILWVPVFMGPSPWLALVLAGVPAIIAALALALAWRTVKRR
ncbi:MFS transporter [Granulicoccus sp. GXG6511]|uniref:MFS transporter n=1 Tax=Granulicoccus sp. GXG6511 TaxID=3381351 RepID=UPI003D7D65B8